MWTAAAMGREANCSYNQCFAFEFHGPLRVESLRAALDSVVARHEALRAVIAPDGTSQTMRAPFSVEMPLHRPVELDSDERGATNSSVCWTWSARRRSTSPRARWCARSSCASRRMRHRFVLTVHHIVCDGWSSSVLFSDLGPLYAADCVGIPAQLGPAASVSGVRRRADERDSRRRCRGGRGATGRRSSPTGTPVLDLPLQGSRPAVKTYRSGREDPADRHGAVRRAQANRGAVGSDAVRDARRRLRGASVSPLRPDRPRRRHPVRRPTSARERRRSSPIA